jgi:hypothetical protein
LQSLQISALVEKCCRLKRRKSKKGGSSVRMKVKERKKGEEVMQYNCRMGGVISFYNKVASRIPDGSTLQRVMW